MRIYVNGKPFGFQPKYGSSILPIRMHLFDLFIIYKMGRNSKVALNLK